MAVEPTSRQISGRNADVDSAASEDVWIPGGSQTQQSTARQLLIVSADAVDDGGAFAAGHMTVLDSSEMLPTKATGIVSIVSIDACVGQKATGSVVVTDYASGIATKATGTIEVLDYTKAAEAKATATIEVLDYTKAIESKAAQDLTVVDYALAAEAIASGTVAIADYTKAVAIQANGTVTIADYTLASAVKASATLTVVNYANLANDTITIGPHTLRTNVDFNAETSNTITAANIAFAINALANFEASSADDVVTIQAATPGTAANGTPLVVSDAVNLTLSASSLAGGREATTVTVDNSLLIADVNWTAQTSNDKTATNLATAIDNLASVAGAAITNVVTVTAAEAGTAGNSLTLATSNKNAASVSGAKLTGGQNNLTVTINGTALTQGTHFDAETSDAATATALASAIDALTGVDCTASTVNAVVSAAIAGSAGNSITLATSDVTAATVSGATLSGGRDHLQITVGDEVLINGTDFTATADNKTTAGKIATAIDALDDVGAANVDEVITITAATAGSAGNTISISSSNVSSVSAAGATLIGGQDHLTVTVGEDELVQGTDFTAETDEDTTATNLAAKIDTLTPVGAAAVGAVVTITAASAGSDGNTISISSSDVTAATASGATLSGGQDNLTINVAGTDLVQGTDFTAVTSNTVTAGSLATAVDGVTGVGGTSDAGVVTVTASTAGTAGNTITMSTSDVTAATVSGAKLSGGLDNLTITVDGNALVQGTDFTAVTSNTVTAGSLATAIGGISGLVASASGGTVSITASAIGAAGNVSLATSDSSIASVSGAKLTGGQDHLELVVGGDTLTQGTDFDAAIDGRQTAIILAETINGLTGVSALRDQFTNKITITADAVGDDGNTIVLTSSSASGIAVSGSGKLAGGHTATTLGIGGSTIVAGIGFDPQADNGDTAIEIARRINALNEGVTATVSSTTINIDAITAGTSGNTIALTTSDVSAATVSAATLENGADPGTGARVIEVEGLDSGHNYVLESLRLDGKTTVTSANSFIRLNSARITEAGSLGSNSAAITITSKTDNNVMAQIAAATSYAQQAFYTVPANRFGQVERVWGTATNATTVHLQVKEFGGTWQTVGTYSTPFDLEVLISAPAKADVRMVAATGTDDTDVQAGFDVGLRV